ncbi:MAG: hypothetical protein IJ722_01220 [Alloprevotella sp.]|nr:hypothetical protein [Alloprevotella sp.]
MDNLQRILYIVRLLLRKWWVVLLTCVVVGGLSAGYIVSIPRSYTSTLTMMPEMNGGNSLGNLANMASQIAGIKLGSGETEDVIYPEFYPKVIGTSDFIADLLKQEVTPKKAGHAVTLYDYFTKYQEVPWWDGLFDGDGEKKVDKDGPLTPDINPRRMTKRQERFVREVSSAIQCFIEKRTTMVTIHVTMQDPDVAAQVVGLVQKRLQSYIIDYRTSKARTDEAYYDQLTAKALIDYKDAQKAYAAFADANQDLVLASVKQEEERLENEMQMAFNVYSQSAMQLQLARAKVQERTPAFTIIQPACVPTKPSAPKRFVFVGMMLVLSFIGSVLAIIFWDHYKRQKRAEVEGGRSAGRTNPEPVEDTAEA